MTYVVDTHPIIWYLEGDVRLSIPATAAFHDINAKIVIPSIVLAEISHLYHRRKIRTSLGNIKSEILSVANASVFPLDDNVVELLPAGLDIHDAIIVATALLHRDQLKEPTKLVTSDRKIVSANLIDVLW